MDAVLNQNLKAIDIQDDLESRPLSNLQLSNPIPSLW